MWWFWFPSHLKNRCYISAFTFSIHSKIMATDYNRILNLSVLTALLLIVSVHLSYSCNEQVCASIVSKCMLTQSCKCDSQNYSCCRECFTCLGHLQLECCSCLGKLDNTQFHFVWKSIVASEKRPIGSHFHSFWTQANIWVWFNWLKWNWVRSSIARIVFAFHIAHDAQNYLHTL